MQSILLVRITSFGDIIHNFPAVTDLARHFPHARIDWLVEESFAELPRLHPAIHTVIPCAQRRWRKQLFNPKTWTEFAQCKAQLRDNDYDLVIDSQGLIKSALLSRLANAPVAGLDANSARERLANLFYTHTYNIPSKMDAISRNRRLTAQACGYDINTPIEFGIDRILETQPWIPTQPYIVLMTGTSRVDKQWATANWITIGKMLHQQGYQLVLPWGSPIEQHYCETLACAFPAIVAPKTSLREVAILLQSAHLVIGPDTGVVHFAAALNTPCIMIFIASDPSRTGVQGSNYAVNIGACDAPPSVDAVLVAIEKGLAI
jgi:heptosyltransferase-1